MLAIDTDILAIHHIFKKDQRFEIVNRFFEKLAGNEKAVTVFNALEFYGMLITTTGQDNASEIFHRFISSKDITILFPNLIVKDCEDFWALLFSECFTRIQKGMRLGDAAILWTLETNHEVDTFVTWNTKHFKDKTSLKVLTPNEFV